MWSKPETDTSNIDKIPNVVAYEYAKKHVNNFNLALDIGAHVGTMSVRMAEDFKHVIAFEPAFYEHTIANTPDNVEVIPMGLGDVVDEDAVMNVCEYQTGSSSLIKHPTCKHHKVTTPKSVHLTTLDSFNFTDIDFIKIDVEFYEWFVLTGGKKTLTENRPVVMIEYLKTRENPEHPHWECHALLESYGYKVEGSVKDDYIYVPV